MSAWKDLIECIFDLVTTVIAVIREDSIPLFNIFRHDDTHTFIGKIFGAIFGVLMLFMALMFLIMAAVMLICAVLLLPIILPLFGIVYYELQFIIFKKNNRLTLKEIFE